MPWVSAKVTLTKEQRKELKKIAGSKDSTEREKVRALVVLLCAEGLKNKEIAKRLRVHENMVVKWRGRWKEDNTDPKSVSDYGELTGRPRSVLTEAKLSRIYDMVRSTPPKNHYRWTVRSLAKAMNIPIATAQRALVELDVKLYENG